jgi:hypothetical protein
MAQSNAVGTIITLGVIGAAAWALYEWLSSQCSTPGSSLYGGSICGFIPGVTVSASTPATTSGATAGTPATTAAATTAPAVTQTTATLSNATSPGAPFAAGDNFQLVITGPANSPVVGTASQNGAVSSSTNFGTTNASGQLIITGGWGAGDVGSWQETWQVGTATPAALNFSIAAAGVSGLSSNRVPIGQIHRMRLG